MWTIMEDLRPRLVALLFLIILMLIVPVVLIALDYWAGIRKAKKRGDEIRSDKMKRTLDKISRYYNSIFAMMVLDAIQISGFIYLHLYNEWSAWTFPLFTVLAVLFVAGVEIKSIYEPADVKETRELKEAAELAKAIVANRCDPEMIAAAIGKYLTNQNLDDDGTEN